MTSPPATRRPFRGAPGLRFIALSSLLEAELPSPELGILWRAERGTRGEAVHTENGPRARSFRGRNSKNLLRGPRVLLGYEPVTRGVDGCLGTVGRIGLCEDVAHVASDSVKANNELVGDILIAAAGRDEAQHLHLAVR